MQWSMAVELNSPLTSVSLLPYKTKGTIRAPVPLLDHMSYDVTGPPTHGRGSIENIFCSQTEHISLRIQCKYACKLSGS